MAGLNLGLSKRWGRLSINVGYVVYMRCIVHCLSPTHVVLDLQIFLISMLDVIS
jgi:hypothetical protein